MALQKHSDGTYSVDNGTNHPKKNVPVFSEIISITPRVSLAKLITTDETDKWVLINKEGAICQPILFEGKPEISEIKGETFKWEGVITKFDFSILP